ncbi:aldose epimerase family protein [Sphingobacterium hotanense]|uniref:aldose epimerase family protein n=1 Tax=Sphingobacterium hotanense TaxID=649196 RepID=UPI0011F26C55|nr:aldose epimerase family protein [Sphingobacterium hotanense]
MNKKLINLILGCALLALLSCQQGTKQDKTSPSPTGSKELVDSAQFNEDIDGKAVRLFILKNAKGATAYLTNFGARLVGLVVPNKDGAMTDVVLGFSKASLYNNPEEPYFGPIVGPFGNRIANGKFSIDGEQYTTPTNNGKNTLHGGFKGLHFANWEAKQIDEKSVVFSHTLPDRYEGFPGNIKIEVTYSLSDHDELTIAYHATTDKKTVINLTNHAYFNLNGEGSGSILNHQLTLFADQMTPMDSTLIPTGAISSVKGTPFDFTSAKSIGKDIEVANEQLTFGKGFDHNFVLNGTKVDGLNHAAKVVGDQSGIVMDIYTEEPGIQFYSGNFMAEKVTLKNGNKDSFRTGFCLEPQHFPDSPNQPNFPSTILNPGDSYSTKSVYKFSVQ